MYCLDTKFVFQWKKIWSGTKNPFLQFFLLFSKRIFFSFFIPWLLYKRKLIFLSGNWLANVCFLLDWPEISKRLRLPYLLRIAETPHNCITNKHSNGFCFFSPFIHWHLWGDKDKIGVLKLSTRVLKFILFVNFVITFLIFNIFGFIVSEYLDLDSYEFENALIIMS